MFAVAASSIQRVPALHVCRLVAEGRLPELPAEVLAMEQMGARRDPTLTEVARLTWLLAGDVEKPSGVAAYLDRFDYPSGSDVRDVVHVAGSRRSIVALLRHLLDASRDAGLRCIGSIDARNLAMMQMLGRLQFVRTRIIFEDSPCHS